MFKLRSMKVNAPDIRLADGSTYKAYTINIKRIEVGGLVMYNIIGIVAPTQNAPLWAMHKYFEIYDKELKPLIIETAPQSLEGEHGLNTHTSAVVVRGIDYAIHLGRDPLPVVFACAFHDIARTHDGLDMEHGQNAVPMAMKIMNNFPLDG